MRAGGAQEIRETDERAGVAQEAREETEKIFRQSAEAKAEAEENAAVLEKLEKNGAFDEIADNSEENAAILERLQHSPERAELLIILLKSPVDGGQGCT